MNNQFKQWEESENQAEPLNKAMIMQTMKKAKKDTRLHAIKVTLISCCSFLFFVFACVNLFPQSVVALEGISWLHDLLDVFYLNQTEQAAIENEYFQTFDAPIEGNLYHLHIDVLMADEKKIIIHGQLTDKDNQPVSHELQKNAYIDGKVYDTHHHAYSFDTDRNISNDGTFDLTIITHEDVMEKSLLVLNLKKGSNKTENQSLYEEIDTFHIPIDQKKIKKKKTLELNQTYEVAGIDFTVEKVDVYPLGVEVSVSSSDPSTLIYFVNFSIHTDKEILTYSSGTIKQAVGNEAIYYLESPYFLNNDFELHIDSLKVIPTEEYILRYDLMSEKFDWLPEEFILEEVIQNEEKYTLVFSSAIWSEQFISHYDYDINYIHYSEDLTDKYIEKLELDQNDLEGYNELFFHNLVYDTIECDINIPLK